MVNNDELYHYGVKGMKWGVRRRRDSNPYSSNRAQAKEEYKTAKQNLKAASKTKGGYIGVKGIEKAQQKEKKVNKASMDVLSKKAAYNKTKARTAKGAERAEFKTYRKEMSKTGLAGSVRDEQSGGRSTQIYNRLKVEKGKEYADRVQKSVQNRAIAEFATGAVVTVGSMAVSAYLQNRYR